MAALDRSGGSSPEQVQRGLAALTHRGPDGARTWRSPGGHITLGHARLSIIDLVTGDQPISNESDSVQVVVNGEFYGYERIRTKLETQGHRFKTRSDSEILVHLYEEFGTRCVDHLRGEYAFVLWDESNQLLFAARDRFGIKPLFFGELSGMLLFASEVKALHAAGVPANWDEQGFFEKLVLHSQLEGRTLFRQVKELPPAHTLIATNGTLTQRRYWDFNYPLESDIAAARSDEDHADQLLEILNAAVRTRMRADVPIACYLSGGIDSSSILGLMSSQSSAPVQAFCLAFDDPAYDECSGARETADHLNAIFNPIPVTQASLAADFEQAVWHGETVFTNAQCVAKFALSRAVRDAGFPVVLTGEGADEVLGGYPVFVMDAARDRCRGDARLTPTPSPASSIFLDRLGYWPAWHENQEALLVHLRRLLPTRFDTEMTHRRFLDGLGLCRQMTGRSILNQSLYLYNQTSLPGHILTVMGDRMEMAHSVEARLPFLDHQVVEFCRTLPSSMKIRDFAEKFILRKAMRLVVPPAVCGRRKQALQAPPFLFSGGPMKELLQDTLRGSALDAIPFLNKPAAIRLLDTALSANPKTSAMLESPLTILLTSCLLSKTFHLT